MKNSDDYADARPGLFLEPNVEAEIFQAVARDEMFLQTKEIRDFKEKYVLTDEQTLNSFVGKVEVTANVPAIDSDPPDMVRSGHINLVYRFEYVLTFDDAQAAYVFVDTGIGEEVQNLIEARAKEILEKYEGDPFSDIGPGQDSSPKLDSYYADVDEMIKEVRMLSGGELNWMIKFEMLDDAPSFNRSSPVYGPGTDPLRGIETQLTQAEPAVLPVIKPSI